MGSTADYYDSFSKNYHLIYDDWNQSIRKQALIIKKIIQSECKKGLSFTLLDCTCGIGTQTIGLAALGFNIQGSDISPAAIKRAKQETSIRHLDIKYQVRDLFHLSDSKKKFDIIISFDNSIPHITGAKMLAVAFREIKKSLSEDGVFIFSIRDYNKILQKKETYSPPYFYKQGSEEAIMMQIWNWKKNNIYEVHQHITVKKKNEWQHNHCYTTYRAYKRQELSRLAKHAGFSSVKWLMPEKTGYHQPIAIAKLR